MKSSIRIPDRMKAVQCTNYGNVHDVLSVQDNIPVPRLMDIPERERTSYMVVKVLSVSLAPGDCRVLSGITRELQGPSHMPYIPGGDCCGIVVELPDTTTTINATKNVLPFQIGDRVVARFHGKPLGALGEYAIVSTKIADIVPDHISSDDAAALISASPAMDICDPITKGERVLVLGANGGIGAHVCQVLRMKEVSYLVGVSKSPSLLLQPPLNCDDAIDYTTTDVYSVPKYQQDKFDTIIDLAGFGYQHLEDCMKRHDNHLIIHSASNGGRYITTVPLHGPTYEVHSIWAALQIFVLPALWKAFLSRTIYRNKLPKYSFSLALKSDRTPATKCMQYAKNGILQAVIDAQGPFPFTTEGVRKAFDLQESRHAHGKVVIHVSDS